MGGSLPSCALRVPVRLPVLLPSLSHCVQRGADSDRAVSAEGRRVRVEAPKVLSPLPRLPKAHAARLSSLSRQERTERAVSLQPTVVQSQAELFAALVNNQLLSSLLWTRLCALRESAADGVDDDALLHVRTGCLPCSCLVVVPRGLSCLSVSPRPETASSAPMSKASAMAAYRTLWPLWAARHLD
jgi:hypothetical protein